MVDVVVDTVTYVILRLGVNGGRDGVCLFLAADGEGTEKGNHCDGDNYFFHFCLSFGFIILDVYFINGLICCLLCVWYMLIRFLCIEATAKSHSSTLLYDTTLKGYFFDINENDT